MYSLLYAIVNLYFILVNKWNRITGKPKMEEADSY